MQALVFSLRRLPARRFVGAGGVLLVALFAGCVRQNVGEDRPNVVLIMADDMGFADIAPYGGEIDTPNLDRLASGGVRFTQFYNVPRCSPTRAALLTGLYPHQVGLGILASPPHAEREDRGWPGYRGYLSSESATLAEVLRAAGYHTLMSGKWHLGMHDGATWPLQRGFDRFYGLLSGASNYFDPEPAQALMLGNDRVEPGDADYYTTDAFTEHAIRFIQEVHEQDDRPFFAYVAYTSPHWPLHAPAEEIEKYRGRYLVGWDSLRAQRLRRQVEEGIISSSWPLSENETPAWDTLTDEKRSEMDLRMAIYAAQVDRMDRNIGRILDALEEIGELDDTLILFLSDNGGCAEGGMLGGGDAVDLGSDRGWVLSYGEAWANASNTPFRRFKHWVHEGGIATPLIAHWPRRFGAGGTLRRQPGHVIDVMPTVLEATGAEYPAEREGHRVPPLEGTSLLPAILHDARIERDALYWEHEGNAAVRRDRWKLVRLNAGAWELYDMEADRTEMHDLAAAQPERVESMAQMYDEWAARVRVRPYPVEPSETNQPTALRQ